MNGVNRHIKYAFAMGVTVIAAGAVGYRILMGWSMLDCIYMTIITLATVGFKEITPLTPAAKIFTILLIFAGVATVGYSVRVIAEYIIEHDIFTNISKRRMERRLAAMKDHIIVCGYGRIGQHVVRSADRSRTAPGPILG